MFKKNLFIAFALLFALSAKAQESEKALYVKGNALFLPVLMFNAGFEYQLSNKFTLQADGFISPWRSFAGNHAQVYMGHLEGRYYFNQAFDQWYVGGNAGFGVYDLTKYNYVGTEKFQRGFNYMLGASVGYQWQWKERWNIDVFLRGGNSQGFYRGYESVPPNGFIRYDDPEWTRKWNKSGEWIPYGGGVMIAYKLK